MAVLAMARKGGMATSSRAPALRATGPIRIGKSVTSSPRSRSRQALIALDGPSTRGRRSELWVQVHNLAPLVPTGDFQMRIDSLPASIPVIPADIEIHGMRRVLDDLLPYLRNQGSSIRKGLFKNGRRQTVARSNAGQAQASTATAETDWRASRSIVTSVLTGIPILAIHLSANPLPDTFQN